MDRDIFNLNVFTNVASPDPAHCLAQHAVRSFHEVFAAGTHRRIVTRIFIDANPHRQTLDAWKETIRKALPDVPFEFIATDGLIDGFARSLEICEGEYAMQLEHDFVFMKNRITHTLDEMLDWMGAHEVNYLRFNKRTNKPAVYDLALEPRGDADFPVCRVSGRSNNPHIIDMRYYREMVLPHLRRPDGSTCGLEGGMCRIVGGGYIYGSLGLPRTVDHLDGRMLRFKDAIRRNLYLARQKRTA